MSKRASRKFPDIGETIERFVQEHKMGADAWRRTGVLTFDGNTKLKEKVTYEKIHQHLQDTITNSHTALSSSCVSHEQEKKAGKGVHGYC